MSGVVSLGRNKVRTDALNRTISVKTRALSTVVAGTRAPNG